MKSEELKKELDDLLDTVGYSVAIYVKTSSCSHRISYFSLEEHDEETIKGKIHYANKIEDGFEVVGDFLQVENFTRKLFDYNQMVYKKSRILTLIPINEIEYIYTSESIQYEEVEIGKEAKQ